MKPLFVWVTNDDREVRPDQMDTLHLFHTVRMLWNHTVPDKHQLHPFRQWVFTYGGPYRIEAMTEMLAELGRRLVKDLTPDQRADLEVIRKGQKVFVAAATALNDGCDPRYADEGDEDPFHGLDQWDLF